MKTHDKIVCALMALIGIILIFPLLMQALFGYIIFSGGGFEEGGYIHYINRSNSDVLILSQSYESGAWDGATTTRLVKKNIRTDEVQLIDTSKINKNEWIEIKTKELDREEFNYFMGEGYTQFYSDLDKKGKHIFNYKNEKLFKELRSPIDQLPTVWKDIKTYSDNTFSEDFRAFVYVIHEALVLNTVTKDFCMIDQQTLMKKDEGPGFKYHLYSTFTDKNNFSVTRNYKTFELDAEGKPKKDTLIEVDIMNYYEISDNGYIQKKDSGIFGVIHIY